MSASAPAFSGLLRRGLRRATTTGGDQLLTSVTNFGVSLVVVRQVSISGFGAFSLAFATYLFVMGLARAAGADPLMVRHSDRGVEEWRGAVRRGAGAALAVSLAGSVLIAATALLLAGDVGRPLLALALVLPALLLQDFWRFAAFAGRQPSEAFRSDAVRLLCLAAVFAVLVQSGTADSAMYVLAWGGSAAVAGVLTAVRLGGQPDVRAARSWLREQRALVPSLAGDFLVTSGGNQLMAFALGAIAGIGRAWCAAGRGAGVGPVNIVVTGGYLLVIPEAARLRKYPDHYLLWFLAMLSGAIVLAAMVWGLAVYAAPQELGMRVLGDIWPLARPVVPGYAAGLVAIGLASGATAGLRVIERPDLSLRVRLVVTPLSLLGGVLGAVAAGAAGAAWGMAVPMLGGAAVWWTVFLAHAKRPLSPEREITAAGSGPS
jgi:hypothetical protein